MKELNRREFIKTVAAGSAALSIPNLLSCAAQRPQTETPVVSIVRIKRDNVDYAVRHAIDLLGGINHVAEGKERILIKPNLVAPEPRDVTKRNVVEALTRLMIEAGRDVSIGEGSAAGPPNFRPQIFGAVCRTKDIDQLNEIQRIVFEALGYHDLSRTLKVPLVNLHTGEMSTVKLPDGHVFKEITLHQALVDTDLLCSVPMMKTHGLAGVTLGMKNLVGVYPGQEYGTVRSWVHTEAAKVEPSGTASMVVDMVRANKLGLVVIDASTAMQGQGPSVHRGGQLVKMDLIIAGTNPLATDMVGATVMGFQPEEISTFDWAWKASMAPTGIDEIEIRGEKIANVAQSFMRPAVIPWKNIHHYGPPC